MRPSPVDRVRARVRRSVGDAAARAIPDGFQRLGPVVVVKLPEAMRPAFGSVGAAYRAEMGVRTVLRRRGPIRGDWRTPDVEVIAGAATETEVRENGLRYRFDAARVMFAEGNGAERLRAGTLTRPGETVADLFAGIGYFTLPAAVLGGASRVYACEANPLSYRYLEENLRINGVTDRVVAFLGDNRAAPIPPRSVDRIFLGLLPSSVPYVARAIDLLAGDGGWVHAHRLAGSRGGVVESETEVRSTVERAGGCVLELEGREVKPYGPGRSHVVVDCRV
ncbi:MAG TPA: class I SAM-dependent methyltransferase family protein, partial [Thermoplasmata archaeon]